LEKSLNSNRLDNRVDRKASAQLFAFLAVLFIATATATAAFAEAEPEYDADRRNHFSVVAAGSRLFVDGHEDESAFTVGGDYEYRVSRLLGVGLILEHAFDPIDATTFLGVFDIHVWRGFALQTGGGVEWTSDGSNAVGRIGGLYEFELERGFTIAPQVHYDFSKEDTLVFGVGFGRAF